MEAVDRVVVERGVAGLAATACVRVRDPGGRSVGSGFLVGPDLVATCAHVVAAATRSDAYAASAPPAAIAVDFPMLARGAAYRNATVHRWVPIDDDGGGDVALLRLDHPAPPGAVMSPVRRVDGLWDHPFRAFGFPEGLADGVWATGRIRGGQGTGWFQLHGDAGGQRIEGGFSGSPVWDDASGAVVGMTVAADRDPAVTTAYLISIEKVLGLDPELLPCPYRGLEPFDEEHSDYYFGRVPELRRLREAVDRSPLVAVDGPSGVGKSSLVRAGLLPALRAEGVRCAQVQPRPGLPALADVVTAVLTLADPGSSAAHHARDSARINAALADPATRAAAVDELAAGIATAETARLLLVVDQFEELTEAAPDAGHELLAVLSELAVRGGAAGPLRIVLTVRGLALDTALTPAIADALGSGSVLVGPMDRSRLREVIVRPAERAPGLAFEDGLVDRILDDAGSEPGQLPFVESLLAQLWARREGGTLTHRGYEASGEVAGALAVHAERVVSAVVTEPRSAAALRALCTRLAAPGRDGRFVRKAIRYVDLPPELRELVPVLAAGRLVVVAGGTGSGGTVELAHQALLEHWPRLRDWLDADREFLVWHAALADDRQRWEAAGRDHGALLRGTALAGAEDWARRRGAELSGPELDYIHHSRSRRLRDVRRTRLIGATVGALTLVAGLLTVVAVRGTEQLATQQAQTNAEVLAAQAAATTRLDPLLAAELAQAAWRSDPTDPRARSVLGGQYLALESAEAVLTGGPGGAPISTISAAGIPDSGVVEVVSTEGVTVLSGALQPAAQAVHLPPVVAGQGSVSPDARHYAAVSADGAVRLWISVADPATEIQLAGPSPEPVLLAGFAPDSSRVGWLTRTPDGRYALTTYDLLTGTAATATIDLPAPPTEVHLTATPDRVLVRSGATGTPNDRLAVHSLAGGAETWVAPQGSLTGAAGSAVTSCAAGDIAAGRRTTLAVTDPATGAATRTLPLMVGTTCEFLWLTADGRFALEPSPAATDAHNSTWRATDLSSGRSYQFLTPPVNIGDWPKAKRSPTIAVLPAADGSATAVVAAGPAVLKVRTSPEIPPDDGGMPPPSRVLDPTGRVLVTSGPAGMAAYDAATGQELGRRSDPLTKDVIQFWDDQPWMLDRGAGGWVLTGYSLPDLTRTTTITLPAGPGTQPGRDGVRVAINGPVDGPPQTVLTLAGGVLAAWDATTGQPLGTPVQLAADVTQSQWYEANGQLWPREGHPDQALVGTPDRRVQLWDVPAGRMLLDLSIEVIGPSSIAAAGDRLAVHTKWDTVEIWDLAAGEQLVADLPLADVVSFRGFTADGNLVAVRDRSFDDARIVLYSIDERAEIATLMPSGVGYALVDPTAVRLSGEYGLMPSAVSTDVEHWREQVCRFTPSTPSAAALAAFPPGVDGAAACP